MAGNESDVTVTWLPNSESDLRLYRVFWGTASGLYFGEYEVPEEETSLRITELQNEVKYYFVVIAVDDAGNASPPSEEVTSTPGDGSAPPQVLDLIAYPYPGPPLSADLLTLPARRPLSTTPPRTPATGILPRRGSPRRTPPAPPSSSSSTWAPPRPWTGWSSPRTGRTRSSSPVDFDLDVSVNGSDWQVAGGLRDVSLGATEQADLKLAAVDARYVRLRVLESFQHVSGLYYAGVGEMTAYEISTHPDRISLEFTAPGDDPGEGSADHYDIRYSSEPITESIFNTLATVPSPVPTAAGVTEYVDVEGLLPESLYYFALMAVDEAGNTSPMSNVASASTLVIPPGAVSDLIVEGTAPGEVTLGWTAVGADGLAGQASTYDIRYSDAPIDAGNVGLAPSVTTPPTPAPSGTHESFTVTGLTQGGAVLLRGARHRRRRRGRRALRRGRGDSGRRPGRHPPPRRCRIWRPWAPTRATS